MNKANEKYTRYFMETGNCPNCHKPMPTPKCSCGCEHKGDPVMDEWVMRHYTIVGGNREICDNEVSLEWWERYKTERTERSNNG